MPYSASNLILVAVSGTSTVNLGLLSPQCKCTYACQAINDSPAQKLYSDEG